MENETINNNPVKVNSNYPGLYIVAIIVGFLALVTIVTQFLSVVFDAVNIAYPDALRGAVGTSSDYSSIRLSISALIVLYPLYIFISYKLAQGVNMYASLKESGLRKFVIYASIVITSLTLVGTLISAIYYFLGGEFTMPFFLKAMAVLFTAIFVGAYYYTQLYRDTLSYPKLPYALGITASIFVLVSIIWSISVIGTPSVMRDRKLDNQRVEDLSSIQSEIVNYWSRNSELPEDLTSIVSSVNYFEMPYDPVTGEMYEYKLITQSTSIDKVDASNNQENRKIVSDGVFEICATFNSEKKAQTLSVKDEAVRVSTGALGFYATSYDYSYQEPTSSKWNHEKGRQCFTRIVSDKFINTYR